MTTRKELLEEQRKLVARLNEITIMLTVLIDEKPSAPAERIIKMDVAREWVREHPTATRQQFMTELSDLGGSAMLSNYWQQIKPK